MDQEALREIWAELCFHLSDNISPNINENVFEQKVLFTLEKLLGWSQFNGEIKVKPSLQIGRQNYITPDIVLYTPGNKAVVVLEIKRPAEDLSRPGCIGQLQSYMRQTKADFGLLVGKEIYVYYDGILSLHTDPLLLSKILFKSDTAEGIDFVKIFNRNSFIAGEYESYLNAHIDRLDRERRIDAVREQLKSEKTSQKMLKLLHDEFRDVEPQILMEAMKGLTLKISYQHYYEKKKNCLPDALITKEKQETVFVCKNKNSGKYFIYIEDLKDNEVHLISPDGVPIALKANLFDQPKDESIDDLFSSKLITEIQLEKYNDYELQQSEDLDTSTEDLPNKIKNKRIQSPGKTKGRKSASPSADEWSRGVQELSKISDRVTWRAICDFLKVEVGGNSARRVLKDWARENRRDWPVIPEP